MHVKDLLFGNVFNIFSPKEIIIVPDGQLWFLPFEYIIDGDSNINAGFDAICRYASSLDELLIRHRSSGRSARSVDLAMV